MFNKKYVYLSIALLIVAFATWSWRDFQPTTEANLQTAPQPTVAAPRAETTPISAAQNAITTLPNLDPFATLALSAKFPLRTSGESSIAAMRRLRDGRSLAEAKLAAAQSDDPVVWVNALTMLFPCMSETISRAKAETSPFVTARPSAVKVGDHANEDDLNVQFNELRANGAPQRVHPPAEARDAMKAELSLSIDERVDRFEKGKRDIANEMHLWRLMSAPMTDGEQRALASLRQSLVEACPFNVFSKSFSDAYRTQREKLASEGSLSALLFNQNAGWTSGNNTKELSERDYALIERAIREQTPDALATLLLRMKVYGDPGVVALPDNAQLAEIVLGFQASRVAACVFSATDCSPQGWLFQETCLMHGGCDQADVASLWRYVLARDGLPPDAMDRVVADLVGKIRRGDLDALGIRRKK